MRTRKEKERDMFHTTSLRGTMAAGPARGSLILALYLIMAFHFRLAPASAARTQLQDLPRHPCAGFHSLSGSSIFPLALCSLAPWCLNSLPVHPTACLASV
ncbi:unnamed protein product [Prorocentrum cordatum]|uniref:Uncharacterized protein n=1 Tax=Prorocentrum cordatum TaxID=2364126 RepID=A0ABN9WUH7_9DINO|nr:unnamed protein product [Polarella glacialis]